MKKTSAITAFHKLALGFPYQATKCVRFVKQNEKTKTRSLKNQETPSHTALMPVLILAQVCAIMPLHGITAKSPKRLKFTWINFRMIYSLFVMSVQLMNAFYAVRYAFNNKINISILESIFFYLSKIILAAHFIWMARKWPAFMIEWHRIGQAIPACVKRNKGITTLSRIKIITILTSMVTMIEHTLSVCTGIFRTRICTNTTDFDSFFKYGWPQIYTFVKYDGGVFGMLGEFINYYCVFQWVFLDLFIISISICLSTRFNQLNEDLKQFQGMKMSALFWSNQRLHFTSLSKLVAKVDKQLSFVIVLSVITNLYYVLIQLLNSFDTQDTSFEAIYFWFSMAFLLFRTIFVGLSAARVYDESRKPADIIRAIPNDAYDMEAKRFLEQIINTKVGISGMRFFYFTRPLILSVIGTILTYELVLVQFQVLTPKTKETVCKAFY